MNDELIQAALMKFQRGGVPGDVVAVFDRETGNPGLDGRKFRFDATNGRRVVSVEALLAGSNGGGRDVDFDAAILEAAVERGISRSYYRPEFLMEELAAADPISLRRDDLRPHPPKDRSIFSS